MQLEPLYRVTFTTPEAWSVTRPGSGGAEGQSFLIAEGRATGRLSARYRAANYPRRRGDGALEPSFRGVLETDDGAAVLFRWDGLAALTDSGMRHCSGRSTRHRRRPVRLAERPGLRRRGRGPPARRRRRVRCRAGRQPHGVGARRRGMMEG